MKVLLINKYLYPRGGDAVSTITTGEILGERGHDVQFWGMSHPDNPEYEMSRHFVDHIDYSATSSFVDQLSATGKLLYSLEARKKLKKLLAEFRPDIVHLNNFAHQISPSILHVLKTEGIPSVMTMRDYKMVCPSYAMLDSGQPCQKCEHQQFSWCFRRKCVKGSAAKSALNTVEMYLHHKVLNIYKNIDCYISPSRFLKNKVKEMGFPFPVEHIFNCVNPKIYIPCYDSTSNEITFFGRLSHEKGLVTLINAVKSLDITLNIIGDGPQKPDLEQYILDNKINNVKLSGHMKGDELYSAIKRALFIVVPSEWYENNPRSVIEAFALGKPVIGSNIGGIPELIKEGKTGLLYEMGDIEGLRNKIAWFLDNRSRIPDMGRAGRKFVDDELNQTVHYEQLIKIYENVVKNAGCS
ncbi:MAG: glycosyltransferase family 4 protein [Gammaproteobacteria bacterium]|nr:glycosyltransferase family 4 protein [Gammaproteobacteria bacterium]